MLVLHNFNVAILQIRGGIADTGQKCARDSTITADNSGTAKFTFKVAAPGQVISYMKGRWDWCVWAVSCWWKYILGHEMFW